ncbi:glycosyl hydrolase family 65 protein [Pigmentiphaga soli]|uniref:Glycosyl hydrolase family 65 protein n=1 Tax=Pigmentiphaga soli TaxID=1007095 RepID=A0ABP8GW71_9BURK
MDCLRTSGPGMPGPRCREAAGRQQDATATRPDICFDRYDREEEGQREALLSLGNGYLSVRAASTASDADDWHYPGTYCAGLYDRAASHVNGRRVENESLVNLPNWLPLTFRPVGEADWFSLDKAALLDYRHGLFLRDGLAVRELRYRDAAGRTTRLREERLVSMDDRHLAASRIELLPEDWSGEIEVLCCIDAGVVNRGVRRFRPYNPRHLSLVDSDADGRGTVRVLVRTRRSGIEVAMATRCLADAGAVLARHPYRRELRIGERLLCRVAQGQPLGLGKVAAIASSRECGGECGQVALGKLARAPDFGALRQAHARAWAALWQRACVEIGEPALQRASRFHVFHLLQNFCEHTADLDAGFPARGWQEAYHGQIFWDEILAFPFYELRFPEVARAALTYRCRRLPAAREAARAAGLPGAMFPWRSASTGREETPAFQFMPLTGHWLPDHTFLQRHIGSATAFNVWQYYLATGDKDFLATHGARLMVEVARFWAGLAVADPADGRYDIRGIAGPDEYHTAYPGRARPGIDNNAYTNLMAAWTLCQVRPALAEVADGGDGDASRRLGLTPAELDRWEDIARRIRVPFSEGRVSQFEGFERLEPFDIGRYRRRAGPGRLDWMLEREGRSVNDVQAAKQSDFLVLLHLFPLDEVLALFARCGYPVAPPDLLRSAQYLLARTSHDSSLSRIIAAGALAELDPAASWELYRQAMMPEKDSADHSSSAEGVHLHAMAGTLDVLQRRYLGLSMATDGLMARPSIPAGLPPVRLPFRCRFGAFELHWSGHRPVLHAAPDNPAEITVRTWQGPRRIAPGTAMPVPADRASAAPGR